MMIDVPIDGDTDAKLWFAIGIISGFVALAPDKFLKSVRRLDPPHRAATRKAVEAILTALNRTEVLDDEADHEAAKRSRDEEHNREETYHDSHPEL